MRHNRAARTPVLLLTAMVLLVSVMSGCTGVPRSSAPQIVKSIDVENGQGIVNDVAPEVGANPRSIVSGFLQASVDATSAHSSARQFLTPDARRIWQDNPTYLVDDFRVEVPDIEGSVATVIVSARKIGSVDSHGQYSPVLNAMGVGSLEVNTFKMRRISGEWRISELQPGVLVRRADFDAFFRPRPLYFLDSSESHLVPDLRYSSLEGQQLATWLLNQLISGPRPELGSAVVNEIPEQLDPTRVTATVADKIKIEIPGSSGIEAVSLQRLAAELAYTFGPIQFLSAVQLTDGGTPVAVPGIGTEFLASRFEDTLGNASPQSPRVYFVCNGALCEDSGKPVVGPLGSSKNKLVSVALHDGGDDNKRVVAVTADKVMRGTVGGGLTPVPLHPTGVLSRPTWQPYTNDAWIAGGSSMYLISPTGAVHGVQMTETAKQSALEPGNIIAQRFSPDGTRLAFILQTPDGTTTVYVGTVVHSGSQTRVESADAVTPPLLRVDDLDWSNPTSLVLVAKGSGTSGGESDAAVWTVQSDGSSLRAQTEPSGLPGAPQVITSAPGQFTVVAAGGAIWVQRSDSWVSLDGSGNTQGSNPVYEE